MSGRFPRPLNPFKAVWDRSTADELYEFLKSLYNGMSGLQKTPDDPSTIQAGDTTDAGTDQAGAKSDHVHGVETGPPTVPIALGGAVSEGSGTPLMRAGATNKLAPGDADKDSLIWDSATSYWVSRPIGFSDSVLGHRSFSGAVRANRIVHEDSEGIISNRAFAERPSYTPGPDDSQVVLSGQIFSRR